MAAADKADFSLCRIIATKPIVSPVAGKDKQLMIWQNNSNMTKM